MATSLDRFAYGLPDPADAPERYYGECAACGSEFECGGEKLCYEDKDFCAGDTGYEHIAKWLIRNGKAKLTNTADVQFNGRMRCEVCNEPEYELYCYEGHTFCCEECLADWLREHGDVYQESVEEVLW